MCVHILVVALACEHVEAHTMLYTSSTSPALLGIALCHETLDKAADLALFVVSHFAVPTGINNTSNIRNRNTRFGDVRRQYNLVLARRRRQKCRTLVLRGHARV